MINPYLPQSAKILNVKEVAPGVKLFRLQFIDLKKQKDFRFYHGQFAQIGLAGLGEAPFDICSDSRSSNKFFEITVRKVGRLTSALHQLKKGQLLTVRGPFGTGWPELSGLSKKNLLLVGGGCGFIPLKSVIEQASLGYAKNHQVQVFYGLSDESQLLFKERYQTWQKAGIDLKIIFDKKKPSKKSINGASCGFGLITKLFETQEVVKGASAFLCGPPVMFKFVIAKLKEHGYQENDIYVSLERKMHCGIGVCQHCAVGEKYVCQDGPVFKYSEIKESLD